MTPSKVVSMKWLILSSSILLFSVSGFAAEKITFACLDNLPPFSYEENGAIKGYDYDIFMEVMNRAQIPVKVTPLPFKRSWAYLKEGEVDGIIMIYFKKEREKYIRYCRTPVHVATFYLFVKKDREFPFESITDLYGKYVGNQLGFYVTPEFSRAVAENKIFMEEAISIEMNLKKLMAGRLDCYISSIRLVRPISVELGISDKIMHLPNPILPKREILMAVSKKSARIKDIDAFIETFSRIRKQLDKDGTIARLDNMYFPTRP